MNFINFKNFCFLQNLTKYKILVAIMGFVNSGI